MSTSVRDGSGRSAAAPDVDRDRLQQVIDEAASFHLAVDPGRLPAVAAAQAGGRVVSVDAVSEIRRLHMRTSGPDAGGLTGVNLVGEPVGTVEIRWAFVERDFVARPDAAADPIPIDRTRSQRFVMQESTFRFATGDAFRCFGAGRTFPMPGGRLLAGAVADLVEGAGCFRNRLGNLTLAGDITADGRFRGHVMVRIVDFDGALRDEAVSPPEPGSGGEEGVTYLTWIAKKGHGADQENTFSFDGSGAPRGLNIPVQLTEVVADFAVDRGFRACRLSTGDVIGREIGFGKEARPRTPTMGTALVPFQFEGVSRYTFWDRRQQPVGTLTANVLEGRSIQLRIPGAPDAPGLRFGYFGPLVTGTGCFAGVEGMLYGTAGSVFAPPPFPHVISNLYVARLHDPAGRWRHKTRTDRCR